MRWIVDAAYALFLIVTAPVWLWRLLVTGKYRTDWPARFGRVQARPRTATGPVVLIHAVSVGEVNAVRGLVARLASHSRRPEVVIAVTTDTGFARAQSLFGSQHRVVRYPLDFSFAVARFLRSVKPDVVVLVELEVWPNFVGACARACIPACVVNGRLSARSAARYQRVRPLLRRSFARLHAVGAQNDAYAARFIALGVPPERVSVTDTMKWDTAVIADHVPGADELAAALGIDRSMPLVVAGSTEPEEHALLHRAMPPGAQLLVAPRKPEWFEDAARELSGCARRSEGTQGSPTGRFLLDTIGELRAAYALADVVVVGRSFGRLHGSDMMEPIGLGKPTIVGPRVADFADTMEALLAGNGVVQTDAAALPQTIARLLSDPAARQALVEHGRAIIRTRQGATERTERIIWSLIETMSTT